MGRGLAALFLIDVLLIIWAPIASNADVTEYKQRHFVLLYAIVIIWTATRGLNAIGAERWLREWPSTAGAVVAAGCCLATLVAYRHVDAAEPLASMGWGHDYYAPHVERGIPQAAAFMRDHSRPGDVMAIGGGGADPKLSGPAIELVSMTDMPCYVGRVDQASTTRGPVIAALVKSRAADIAAVDNAPNQRAAFALLRARAISWYVMVAPALPAWDQTGVEATFRAELVHVYHVPREMGVPADSVRP